MANFVLRLSIRADEIEDFLRQFERRIANPLPLNKNIGEYLVGETQDTRFRTQTDPDRRPWVDLRPATWRRKRQGGSIMKILQQDGSLRRTITYEASNEGVAVGSPLPYAAIHQFGGTIRQRARSSYLNYKIDRSTGRPGNRFAKRRNADFAQPVTYGERTINIPARPYLGISDEYMDAIAELVGDFLLG